jgi:hypothetical protein
LPVTETISIANFSTFYKKKPYQYKKKQSLFKYSEQANSKVLQLKPLHPSKIYLKKNLIFFKNFLSIPSKLYLPKDHFAYLDLTQRNDFFLKMFYFEKFPVKTWWRSLLIAVADLKMRAMLEHYDYFGLYTTARNFITVHSELHINKSLLKIF